MTHLQAAVRQSRQPPVFAYVFLMVMGLLVAGIIKTATDSLTASNQREVLRVTSPDRRLDAVFVRPKLSLLGTDAALYIVPRGETAPGWGALVRGDFRDNPDLAWTAPQLLQLQYGSGCINRFSNLWHSYDIDDGNFYVEVRLKPLGNFTCLTGVGATVTKPVFRPTTHLEAKLPA